MFRLLAMMMLIWTFIAVVEGWVINVNNYHHPYKAMTTRIMTKQRKSPFVSSSSLCMSSETAPKTATAGATSSTTASPSYDYVVPEEAVVHIKPMAMSRLRELREQQAKSGSPSSEDDYLILRMGVRSGGCSGMSYVMDFTTRDLIHAEDDVVDTYEQDRIQCVVDSKSMLYLYGLQLDYSTELIGGGFKFYNPNAEESCGCGSSFGV